MSEGPLVYDLTPMTRKADQGRRFVIGGFDIQKRTMLIGGLALVPGLVLTGSLFPVVGAYSLIAIPIFLALAFWLIEGRSSQGMKLRNWHTMLDKRRSRNGQFFICGHPIDVTYSDVTFVRRLTNPIEQPNRDVADMFAIEENEK